MLNDSNIFQTDAAVIAGLLILLTVTYILAPRSRKEADGEIAFNTVVKISKVSTVVIALFSGSAIIAAAGDIFSSSPYAIWLTLFGEIVMIVGFAALAFGVGWSLWYWAKKKVVKLD